MTREVIDDIYPLTPTQTGILHHTLLEPEADLYIDQLVSTLSAPGGLRPEALEAAGQFLVDRYPALRTALSWERRRRPVQVVLAHATLQAHTKDWRDHDAADQESRLSAWLRRDRRIRFELRRPPLLRICVIRRDEDRYWFVLTYHHMLLDAWSVGVLCRELVQAYGRLERGEELSARSSPTFREYACWINEQSDDGQAEYWRRALAGITSPTSLASGPARAATTNHCGEFQLRLDAAETDRLRDAAKRYRITFYTLFQAAWSLLLSRYTGERRVVFGSTLAGRPAHLAGIEDAVGLFINTLPVCVQLPPDRTVIRWLRDLHEQLAEMRRYEFSSLARVKSWSDVPPELPLFESVVAFENVPDGGMGDAPPLLLEEGRYLFRTNYPLNIMAVPDREFSIRANFDAESIDEALVRQLVPQLRHLLLELARRPDDRLDEVSLLNRRELTESVRAASGARRDYPADVGVHELFERRAHERPDAIAVEDGVRRLTYGELNLGADRLAAYLGRLGVAPEARVGLLSHSRPEMIQAVLAIMKAGGAHVPLDPSYPPERLANMIGLAGIRVLLSDGTLPTGLAGFDGSIVDITRADTWPEANAEMRATATALPDNTAYVIFTSGSTGQPKAIALAHRGLCNMLADWNRLFGVSTESRVLQFASPSFDASVWEIFSALTEGATLCLGSRRTLYSPEHMIELLQTLRVTHALLPPSLLGAIEPAALPELAHVAAIGERCSSQIATAWGAGRRFFNAYGPAEATITVSVYEAPKEPDPNRAPPIGRAMANTQLYVLDDALRPVPRAVTGELFIAGVGVARGYLDKPAATAERFLPDPFGAAGSRMYRTGDVTRIGWDGNLEFVGRKDHQVKIRGVRVELGEVEATLRKHTAVRDAVVVAFEDDGRSRLAAYLIPEHEPTTAQDVRIFLAERLPSQMVPIAYRFLDAFPLDPNGKVDRSRLPKPETEAGRGSADFRAPRTDMEASLTEVWQQVLSVDRVGIHDNYFELGGDSIMSIQLIAQARRRGIEFSSRQLMENQTIAELARVTRNERPATTASAHSGPLPLTPNQLRHLQSRPDNVDHFNQTLLLEIPPGTRVSDWQRALASVRDHHDALRIQAWREGDEWSAEIGEAGGEIELPLFDLSDAVRPSQAVEAVAREEQGRLRLSDGAVLRGALLRMPPTSPSDRLLLIAHHFAVDWMSWSILLDDLREAYASTAGGRSIRLVPSASFSLWSQALRDSVTASDTDTQNWAEALRDIAPIPADRPSGDNTFANTETRSIRLSVDETSSVLDGLLPGDSAQELVLAAAANVIGRWAMKSRITVDLELHGREQTSLVGPIDRTVGWLTSILPISVDTGLADDPLRQLRSVRDTVLAARQSGQSFGAWRYLGSGASAPTSAQPEVCFNYLGTIESVLPAGSGFALAAENPGPMNSPSNLRPYVLELTGLIESGRLRVDWTYSADIHDEATIQLRMSELRDEILRLANANLKREPTDYQPRDFPEVELTESQLSRLLERAGAIDQDGPA